MSPEIVIPILHYIQKPLERKLLECLMLKVCTSLELFVKSNPCTLICYSYYANWDSQNLTIVSHAICVCIYKQLNKPLVNALKQQLANCQLNNLKPYESSETCMLLLSNPHVTRSSNIGGISRWTNLQHIAAKQQWRPTHFNDAPPHKLNPKQQLSHQKQQGYSPICLTLFHTLATMQF